MTETAKSGSKLLTAYVLGFLLLMRLTAPSAWGQVEWTGGSHGQVVTCHSSTGDYQVAYPNNGRWDQNTVVNSDGCTIALSNWSTPTFPNAADASVLVGGQTGEMSYPPYLPQGLVVAVHNLMVDGSAQVVLGGQVDLYGQLSVGDNAVATLSGGVIFGRSVDAAIKTEGSGVLAVGDAQSATLTGDVSIDATLVLGQGSGLILVDLPALDGALRIRSTGSGNTISTNGSQVLSIPAGSRLEFDEARTSFGRRGSGLNLRMNNVGGVTIGNGSNITFAMADQGGTAWVNDGALSLAGSSTATLIVSNLAGEANKFTLDNRNGQVLVNEGSSLYLSRNARILGGTITTGDNSAIRVSDQVGDSANGALSGDLTMDATLALEGHSSLNLWGDTTLAGSTRIVASGSGNRVFGTAETVSGVHSGTLSIPQGSRLSFDGASTAFGRNSGTINNGTVEFDASNVSIEMNDAVRTGWDNSGQFLVRGGSTVGLVQSTPAGTAYNFTFDSRNGEVLVNEGSSLYVWGAHVLGDVSLRDSSALRVMAGGSVRGVVDVGDGSLQFEQGGGHLTGQVVGSSWALAMLPGTDLTIDGELSISGSILFDSNSATNGANRVLGGAGSHMMIERDSTASFVGSGALRMLGPSFTNLGSLEVLPGLAVSWESTSLQNQGLIRIADGAYSGVGGAISLDNTGGKFDIDQGGFAYFENARELGGILVVDGTLTIPQLTILGELEGSGVIQGNLVDTGLVSPGNSPGSLTVNGSFSQPDTGRIELEVTGLLPGVEYDQLIVTGNAGLAGTVNVLFPGGFRPRIGDEFTFFDVGGTFSDENAEYVLPAGYSMAETARGRFQITAVPEPHALGMAFWIFHFIAKRKTHQEGDLV